MIERPKCFNCSNVINHGSKRFCSYECQRDPMRRFMEKVDKNASGCWLWVGKSITEFGYGRFRLNGKAMHAHRASCILYCGAIPKGKIICHRCDNPRCVNYFHLFIGTHADNVNDKIMKMRHTYGEKCGLTKFSNEFIKSLRDRYDPKTKISESLAKKEGLSRRQFKDILTNKTRRLG